MHQNGVARVPDRIEEGQSFGRQGQIDADVGDHKEAFIRGAFHGQVHGRPNTGAATISGNQPVGIQGVGTFRGIDFDAREAVLLGYSVYLVAPAKINQEVGGTGVQQVFLQVLLLQVDHGIEAVVVVVRRLHAEHPFATVVGIAKAPGQSVGANALGHTHLLQNFHGAAREDNRPAALRDLQLGRQHNAAHAQSGQLQCCHHAGRAGAGNHHLGPGGCRMPGR